MKKCLYLIIFLSGLSAINAQSVYFPPVNSNQWDTVSPVTLGYCPDKIDSLYDFLDSIDTKAFVLLKNGKIVLEKYFGDFTVDSTWYWASAGKTLTATLIGIAQQEGYLSITDTTSKYLGRWTSAPLNKESQITIKDQLQMTTGLDDGVQDPFCTLPSCLQYASDAGTRWAYHNGPYTRLLDVLDSATGRGPNLYLFQKLTQSTGISGLFLNAGYNKPLFSKARSMARFGLLILNKGVWDSNVILNDTTFYNDMITPSQSLNESYGYLWWLNGQPSFMIPQSQIVFNGNLNPLSPQDMYSGIGKDGQFLSIVPSQGLVMVRMGNTPGGLVPSVYLDTIWTRINGLQCGTLNTESTLVKNNFIIFPNPTNNYLYLGGNENVSTSYLIFNSQGRLVKSGHTFEGRIEVDHFNEGLYYLKIPGKIKTKPFIIKKGSP